MSLKVLISLLFILTIIGAAQHIQFKDPDIAANKQKAYVNETAINSINLNKTGESPSFNEVTVGSVKISSNLQSDNGNGTYSGAHFSDSNIVITTEKAYWSNGTSISSSSNDITRLISAISKGGNILIRPGIYSGNEGHIDIPSYTNITANGAVFENIAFKFYNISHSSFIGGKFIGSTKDATINISGMTSFISFKDVQIYDPDGTHHAGAFFLWTGDFHKYEFKLNNLTFDNCGCINGGRFAFLLSSDISAPDQSRGWINDTTFDGCYAVACGEDSTRHNDYITGFDVTESPNLRNVVFDHCRADYNWESGFHHEGYGQQEVSYISCEAGYNGYNNPGITFGHGFAILGGGATLINPKAHHNGAGGVASEAVGCGIRLSSIIEGDYNLGYDRRSIIIAPRIYDNVGSGIYTSSTGGAYISGGEIYGTHPYGIVVAGSGDASVPYMATKPTIIDSMSIKGTIAYDGIWIARDPNSGAIGSQITNSIIRSPSRYGIKIDESNCTVSSNYIIGSGSYGIITNNNAKDCMILNNRITSSAGNYNIAVFGDNNIIRGNKILGSVYRSIDVDSSSDGIIIENNVVDKIMVLSGTNMKVRYDTGNTTESSSSSIGTGAMAYWATSLSANATKFS